MTKKVKGKIKFIFYKGIENIKLLPNRQTLLLGHINTKMFFFLTQFNKEP